MGKRGPAPGTPEPENANQYPRKESGRFGEGNKGKPKGATCHLTRSVKEAIELAFEGIGGVPRLIQWAEENPTEFFKGVWVKLLPNKIEATGANGKDLFGPEQLLRMAEEVRAAQNNEIAIKTKP